MSKLIEYLIEAVKGYEVSIRDDYSGRAMYGNRCVGITGSQSDLLRVVGEVAEELAKEAYDIGFAHASDHVTNPPEVREAEGVYEDIKSLLKYSTDSMGKYDMIFYWPDIMDEKGLIEDDEDANDENESEA